MKLLKHKITDYFSTTNKYFFRVEGMTSDKIYKKSTLKKMKPHKSLNLYLKNDNNNLVLNSIIKKLKKYFKLISSKKFDNYILIGSSLLIIYDKKNQKKTSIKIIDFDNCFKDKTSTKYMNNYRKSIANIIKEFENLL